jgi:malate synthase
MKTKNQINVLLKDLVVSERDLVELPQGNITESGIRKNINVGILYIEAWLRGFGAVALYNLMEDAATAEISRSQVWQWLRNNALLEDGRVFDRNLYLSIYKDEVLKIKNSQSENNSTNNQFDRAFKIFNELVQSDAFEEFLTLPAYKYI